MNRWIPLWVIPLLVALAIGTIRVRLNIVDITYEITQTDRMIQNARQHTEKLEVSVAKLRSPRRLEKLAREKFQLRPPQPNQVIHISDNR